ncbi:hypothetical protein VPH35_140730 [Triticum aestivum]
MRRPRSCSCRPRRRRPRPTPSPTPCSPRPSLGRPPLTSPTAASGATASSSRPSRRARWSACASPRTAACCSSRPSTAAAPPSSCPTTPTSSTSSPPTASTSPWPRATPRGPGASSPSSATCSSPSSPSRGSSSSSATLLARAVAGEAGVPFFSCAASEFVELFVGVGASRVRDLFEKAKAKAPCIVFIDEIDAVGRQRGAGMGGGNDEREQTINQLLTEMDGFSGNSGVIVLAATNRPDVLDSALLRPGRFDRQVTVDRPDVAGRVRILEVHSRGKALAKDVDFDKVARRTPGFTGADLQNLMNEAAILAARRDLKEISKDEISDALERIIAGPEKKNAVVSEQKRKLVAYHEAGHALVGALMPEYDPVAKISIIPRGQAGGLTFFAPSEERLESGLYSRSYLENQMAVALGGRVAEEVIFGQDNVTTGASSDFMQVSRVARQMVERFGFSKKIGQVAIGSSGGGNPFLGQQMSSQKDYSMATADIVDAEVRELVETAYSRATQIINTHIDILHRLANLLIEKETVDGEEFMSLFIDGQAELFVA